ncbi:MAG: NUDIX domain-containing protein [Ginsengibacter sp.]
MQKKQSAGLLLYRRYSGDPEVFLVHLGGPFWKKKDDGAWSIPKGEFVDGEDALSAAIREFYEETGYQLKGNFIELQSIKLESGKIVFAWAIEKDIDAAKIISNHFEMEWPPRSGIYQSFPEVDKAAWFNFEIAKKKINIMQVGLLEQLEHKLRINSSP